VARVDAMGGRQRGRPGEDDAEGVHGGFFRARYKGNRRVFRQGVEAGMVSDPAVPARHALKHISKTDPSHWP